jgi:hypothetical protein
MVTPLQKPLKRELRLKDQTFIVTLSSDSLKLTLKGRRKGYELRWEDLITGDAALATALNASIGKFPAASARATPSPSPPASRKSRIPKSS